MTDASNKYTLLKIVNVDVVDSWLIEDAPSKRK